MNCDGDGDIMWMNFNQDGSSLSAGSKAGFYLYGLSNGTEKLDVKFKSLKLFTVIFRNTSTSQLKT